MSNSHLNTNFSILNTKNKMNKIYFTSDHHFGHKSIIKFCNRPFKDVKEMNNVLIRKWNEKIGINDDVYHLGDFGLIHKEDLSNILDRLNGNIHLIAGNHENAAIQNKEKFVWIKNYFELKVKDPDCGSRLIILFHYAMRVWRHDFKESWHLYGHTHGTLPDKNHKLAFDVSVDAHDFYPLSYEDVKVIMSKKNWKPPFD